MAKFSSIYKQTAPTRRTVNGENTYEKGMMWSNQALMPGYTRTLLNFEIDIMTGALTIPGGFHVNTIAAGCTYIDKLYYSDGTYKDVVVTQPRNEYFLRAFEGITNILSVQKLNAKDILQQVSNAPQYLNSVDNVNCYKIITYNPFNHRMVVITLLQSSNSSYILNQDLTIYRLNSNPISMGFSEIWNYEGEPYISNKTDLFPQGMEDTYTVRPRRIKLNETFGKTLHHDYHMYSVPHTEGFGNKTFMFTQEQLTLDALEEDNTVEKDIETKVFSNPQITGSSGYSVRDIVFFKPLLEHPELYSDELYPTGDRIQHLTIQVIGVSETGAILDFKILSPGRFIRTTYWADGTINLTPINDEGATGSITSANTINNITEKYAAQDILNIIDSNNLNPFKNNKYIGKHTSSGRDNIRAKDDDHYFGLLLTGLGIRTKTHNENSALLLNTATVNSDNYPENSNYNYGILDIALVNHLKQSEQLLKLNLNTGIIEGNLATEEVDLFINPVLKRTDTNQSLNQNITDLSKLFKQHVFEGDKKIFLPDFLTDNIKRNLQVGQSIRVAAYCKVDVPLSQNYILNNLRTDVDESNYYRKKTPEYSSVFLLEYVWDGLKWNFTFVDTAYRPSTGSSQPYFMSNWDASSLLYSTLFPWVGMNTPKLVISTEAKANYLSYLDIVTTDNKAQMCKTKDSTYAADLKRIGVGDLINKTSITSLDKGSKILDLDLDETLSDVMNTGAIENTLKKLNNTQYAHFKLKPKELTPAMAARWGYNMLSPTPYTFICQNTPGLSISLTGVLLMRGNQPLLTPLVNTPGELHIYYNADLNGVAQVSPQRYQISVEYKNIYDEWRSLKEYSVAESHDLLSSGQPIVLPFSSPDEIVLIKVTILDRETVVDVATADGSTEDHFLVVSSLITTLSFVKNATQTSIVPEIYDLGTALGLTYWKGRLVCWGVEKAHNMLFLSEPNEPEYFAYPNGVDIFEEDIKHVINYSDALIVFTSTKMWRIDMALDGLTWTKSLLQQNIRISDNDIPYIAIIKNMLFFKSDKQFFMLVPQKSSTTGELTIAPISRAIVDFLKNPFDNLLDMVETIYPEFRLNEKTPFDYLIKYGVHIEQNKVFVDWWFDITAWKNQEKKPDTQEIVHDYEGREYWLIQLIYDTQTYSWSIQTHSTNSVGHFVNDAANSNTDLINLVFSPEFYVVRQGLSNYNLFQKNSPPYSLYDRGSYGVSISNRKTTEEKLLNNFNLNLDQQVIPFEPTYPRFQIFDTGYKEVSSPALKKRFREIQFTFEPRPSTKVAPDGDSVNIKAVLLAQIDGHTVMSSVSQEVVEELEDETLVIKVVDKINYQDIQLEAARTSIVPLPYLVDSELSNTFVLESSALSGVKQVKVRRAINGKGQLIRMRFVNITESNYAIISHAFVSHNKNAR